MILIHTALYWEAKPFIEHYHLKRDLTVHQHQLFIGDGVALIISGIGQLEAAVAASSLLTRYEKNTVSALINIGVAGALAPQQLAKLFVINKVTDRVTDRAYFPECILRHGLLEAELESFPIPVTDSSQLNSPESLVDMEGAGFMKAAASFLSSGKIHLIKVVSDNLICNALSSEQVDSLIGNHKEEIVNFISGAQSLDNGIQPVLNKRDGAVLERIVEKVRLTQAERDILYDDAHGYILRGGQELGKLEEFTGQITSGRTDAKTRLKKIREFLHEEKYLK